MSVLIKGIEMPNNCVECLLSYFDFNNADGIGIRRCVISGWMVSGKIEKDKRMNDCPLVEIPKNHGRLIDADVLHDKMYHESFEVDSDMQKWESGCWIRYKVFENCERQTPTIIEAEE